MIEVDHLTKKFGPHHAVDDISFRVNKGEILGFLGPNGAGKSTTMKMLTTFLPATSGSARINGKDIFEDAFEVKKMVGYLPENPPLYNEMPVKHYLKFAAEIQDVPKSKIAQRIAFAIEKCDLGSFQNRLVGNLSKGMRQRVSLAQALIHDPQVLILDEPTVGLDPAQVIEFRKLIKSFAGDHTVILSTHILTEVEALCSRVTIINRGRIVANETIDSLTNSAGGTDHTEIVVRKFDDNVISSLKNLPGIEAVEKIGGSEGSFRLGISGKYGDDGRTEIARVAVEKNWGITRLTSKRMGLEEVYLKHISGHQGVTT